MANSNCNSTTQCGCTPGAYTVVPPCPPACSEVFNAQCIVYTGADIVCGADTVISRNDYLDSVITKLVSYICTSTTGRDDTSVTAQAITAGPPTSTVACTHTLQQQYVQVLIIDTATNTDVTKEFEVICTSLGNYTLSSGSFTGTVRTIVLG
tara:strand:+ start:19 stop:474 length:456 start_codon:yes stop_codon:yes gene_type:complete